MINHRIKSNNKDNLYYLEGIDKIQRCKYIIVPGAQVGKNSLSTPLEDRLNCAYHLYKNELGDKIILSGGYSKASGVHEVDIMKKYLLEIGVPDEDIITDYYGIDTYSTIQRVREYVGDEPVIVCTQRMYSYRTSYLMRKIGLEGIIVSSDFHIYNVGIKGTLREYLANVKAFLEANLKIKNVKNVLEYGFI